MRRMTAIVFVAALAVGGALLARSRAGETPHHAVPPSKNGNLVVGLCDGVTSAEVPGVKEGETPTREQAQVVSDHLMAEWRRKNPGARWDDAPVEVAQAVVPEEGGTAEPRQGAAEGAAQAGARTEHGAETPGDSPSGVC